jgi:hypothetical protein
MGYLPCGKFSFQKAISDITAASYINILLTQIIQSLYYAPAAIVPIEGAVLFELTFYLLFVFDSRA